MKRLIALNCLLVAAVAVLAVNSPLFQKLPSTTAASVRLAIVSGTNTTVVVKSDGKQLSITVADNEARGDEAISVELDPSQTEPIIFRAPADPNLPVRVLTGNEPAQDVGPPPNGKYQAEGGGPEFEVRADGQDLIWGSVHCVANGPRPDSWFLLDESKEPPRIEEISLRPDKEHPERGVWESLDYQTHKVSKGKFYPRE